MEGLVLGGRYRLLSKLGKGGMATVWRAEHVELGTPVAVKLMDPAIAQDASATQRFKREAQAAARLRSSHVVQIMDYGVDHGTPYIAMELLNGESLADRLDRELALRPSALLKVLRPVGVAVERAHALGIVHRDLKPDNIFVVQDGGEQVVKVLDFGIAKMANDGLQLTHSPETKTGAMLGTPYYMSPEQISGQRAVDHRTDIWAIGVITYECLLGRRPFDGETLVGLGMAICSDPPPVPSTIASVPPGFDAWFSRATARDPEGRFASVREALDELERVLPGENQPGDQLIALSVLSSAESASGSTIAVSSSSGLSNSSSGGISDITAAPASVTLNDGGKTSRAPLLVVLLVLFSSTMVGAPILWLLLRSPDGEVSTTVAAASELVTATAALANEPSPGDLDETRAPDSQEAKPHIEAKPTTSSAASSRTFDSAQARETEPPPKDTEEPERPEVEYPQEQETVQKGPTPRPPAAAPRPAPRPSPRPSPPSQKEPDERIGF